MPRFNLPIRVKILLASILMLMLVVSLITISMARLFQNDKTAYMRDLTSVVARNVSEETNALVASYVRNLRVLMSAARDPNLDQAGREQLIASLFENYTDFLAISVLREGSPPIIIYDSEVFAEVGLTKDDIAKENKISFEASKNLPDGKVLVRNATVSEELPSMNVALPVRDTREEQRTVVAATIRLQPLIDIATRSGTFDVRIFGSDNIILASADLAQVSKRLTDDVLLDLANAATSDTIRSTRDISFRGQEWIASFPRIFEAGITSSIMIPKSAAYLTARDLLRNLVYISIGLFAMAVTLALFFSHRLTRPLEVLSNAASKVGRGEFNVSVKQSTGDEIGLLAHSFNDMTSALRQRDEDLINANQALVQSEKMAAFGQLGAGIAHEVKNPLAGILGYAQLALRKTEEGNPVREKLRIIEKEAKRCSEIIGNLMRFARHEKAEYQPISVNDVIRDAVAITDHQLSINDNEVQIETDEALPVVHGNSNQLQQVLINLLINAEQALGDQHGIVRIASQKLPSGRIGIEVADNGPGIPDEIKARIFEPFFTTKPSGKGTGLGMSVAYRIVEEHGGTIRLESEPGQGARFVIELPAMNPGEKT